MLEEKNGWYRVKGDMRLQEDMLKYKTSNFEKRISGGLAAGFVVAGIWIVISDFLIGFFMFLSFLLIGVWLGNYTYRGIWENEKIEKNEFYVSTVLLVAWLKKGKGKLCIEVEIDGEREVYCCHDGSRELERGERITIAKIDYTNSPVKIFEDKEVFVLDNVYPEYQKEQKKLEKKN